MPQNKKQLKRRSSELSQSKDEAYDALVQLMMLTGEIAAADDLGRDRSSLASELLVKKREFAGITKNVHKNKISEIWLLIESHEFARYKAHELIADLYCDFAKRCNNNDELCIKGLAYGQAEMHYAIAQVYTDDKAIIVQMLLSQAYMQECLAEVSALANEKEEVLDCCNKVRKIYQKLGELNYQYTSKDLATLCGLAEIAQQYVGVQLFAKPIENFSQALAAFNNYFLAKEAAEKLVRMSTSNSPGTPDNPPNKRRGEGFFKEAGGAADAGGEGSTWHPAPGSH
jgi:hypothetical protein